MRKINKISVFGGTGFIGKRFCEMFSENVYIEPRESKIPKYDDVLYLISTTTNYNIFSDVHLDINTNLNKLMDVLPNVKGTFNYISSWFIYGQNSDIPFREDSYCNPKGFYSITKRCAEQLLICFCENFGIKYRIFRLANVIGEQDKNVSERKNALQFFIKEILQNKDILLYNRGLALRDYIYVDDVCNAIDFCMKKSEVNQIINIGSGIPYVFSDILNYAIKISNSKSKIISREPSEFHNKVQVRDAYLDITKLKNLEFKPNYTIKEAIDKIVAYYKL